MPEHPNATLARTAIEAMSQGDLQRLDSLIADDVVWHYIGGSEPLRGKDQLRAMGPGSDRDYEITATVHDVLGTDDHAVALVEATATRGGRTFTYRTAEICHVRDGKVTERWAFSDDTGAIAAFFA
jgi:ketosteroid isomerase-like protein